MARTAKIAKEKQRNKLVARMAALTKKLKAAMNDQSLTEEQRFEARHQFNTRIPKNARPCRLRRRCRQCGRSRGVFRKVGLCRICFRKAMHRGDIPGSEKASW